MVNKALPADFTIGIIGAGQLARMFALSAAEMGIKCRFYAQSKNDPACIVGDFVLGELDERDKLVAFAHDCDIVTLENEFISGELLEEVRLKSGTPIFPSPDSYQKIESKVSQKKLMEELGIPVVGFNEVETWEDCLKFMSTHSPAVLKAVTGGYDGYGNMDLTEDSKDEFEKFKAKNSKVYIEHKVKLKTEWAVLIGCREDQIVSYPACETVQKDHKCDYVLMKRDENSELRVKLKEYAEKIGKALSTRGIFAFEFFELEDGSLVFNESAPRPHNSHHYTQNACNVDQFRLLLLCLLNWELPVPEVLHDAVMGNLLGKRGEEFTPGEAALDGRVHLHLYGKKESRPGRKMGHANIIGKDADELIPLWKKIQESYTW